MRTGMLVMPQQMQRIRAGNTSWKFDISDYRPKYLVWIIITLIFS